MASVHQVPRSAGSDNDHISSSYSVWESSRAKFFALAVACSVLLSLTFAVHPFRPAEAEAQIAPSISNVSMVGCGGSSVDVTYTGLDAAKSYELELYSVDAVGTASTVSSVVLGSTSGMQTVSIPAGDGSYLVRINEVGATDKGISVPVNNLCLTYSATSATAAGTVTPTITGGGQASSQLFTYTGDNTVTVDSSTGVATFTAASASGEVTIERCLINCGTPTALVISMKAPVSINYTGPAPATIVDLGELPVTVEAAKPATITVNGSTISTTFPIASVSATVKTAVSQAGPDGKTTVVTAVMTIVSPVAVDGGTVNLTLPAGQNVNFNVNGQLVTTSFAPSIAPSTLTTTVTATPANGVPTIVTGLVTIAVAQPVDLGETTVTVTGGASAEVVVGASTLQTSFSNVAAAQTVQTSLEYTGSNGVATKATAVIIVVPQAVVDAGETTLQITAGMAVNQSVGNSMVINTTYAPADAPRTDTVVLTAVGADNVTSKLTVTLEVVKAATTVLTTIATTVTAGQAIELVLPLVTTIATSFAVSDAPTSFSTAVQVAMLNGTVTEIAGLLVVLAPPASPTQSDTTVSVNPVTVPGGSSVQVDVPGFLTLDTTFPVSAQTYTTETVVTVTGTDSQVSVAPITIVVTPPAVTTSNLPAITVTAGGEVTAVIPGVTTLNTTFGQQTEASTILASTTLDNNLTVLSATIVVVPSPIGTTTLAFTGNAQITVTLGQNTLTINPPAIGNGATFVTTVEYTTAVSGIVGTQQIALVFQKSAQGIFDVGSVGELNALFNSTGNADLSILAVGSLGLSALGAGAIILGGSGSQSRPQNQPQVSVQPTLRSSAPGPTANNGRGAQPVKVSKTTVTVKSTVKATPAKKAASTKKKTTSSSKKLAKTGADTQSLLAAMLVLTAVGGAGLVAARRIN